ncbi:hypothetical protein ACFSKM_07090 [Ancylobacter dichloromethanicus]
MDSTPSSQRVEADHLLAAALLAFPGETVGRHADRPADHRQAAEIEARRPHLQAVVPARCRVRGKSRRHQRQAEITAIDLEFKVQRDAGALGAEAQRAGGPGDDDAVRRQGRLESDFRGERAERLAEIEAGVGAEPEVPVLVGIFEVERHLGGVEPDLPLALERQRSLMADLQRRQGGGEPGKGERRLRGRGEGERGLLAERESDLDIVDLDRRQLFRSGDLQQVGGKGADRQAGNRERAAHPVVDVDQDVGVDVADAQRRLQPRREALRPPPGEFEAHVADQQGPPADREWQEAGRDHREAIAALVRIGGDREIDELQALPAGHGIEPCGEGRRQRDRAALGKPGAESALRQGERGLEPNHVGAAADLANAARLGLEGEFGVPVAPRGAEAGREADQIEQGERRGVVQPQRDPPTVEPGQRRGDFEPPQPGDDRVHRAQRTTERGLDLGHEPLDQRPGLDRVRRIGHQRQPLRAGIDPDRGRQRLLVERDPPVEAERELRRGAARLHPLRTDAGADQRDGQPPVQQRQRFGGEFGAGLDPVAIRPPADAAGDAHAALQPEAPALRGVEVRQQRRLAGEIDADPQRRRLVRPVRVELAGQGTYARPVLGAHPAREAPDSGEIVGGVAEPDRAKPQRLVDRALRRLERAIGIARAPDLAVFAGGDEQTRRVRPRALGAEQRQSELPGRDRAAALGKRGQPGVELIAAMVLEAKSLELPGVDRGQEPRRRCIVPFIAAGHPRRPLLV